MNPNQQVQARDQINYTSVIQYLKSRNALSKETAVEITSDEWYELGFSYGSPLGSLLLSPVRSDKGKYWYDASATKSLVNLNRAIGIGIGLLVLCMLCAFSCLAIAIVTQRLVITDYPTFE